MRRPRAPARCLRCRAHTTRTKHPCRRWAIRGGTVCRTHGGAAPQVRRKAVERLADLIDPNRLLRHTAYLAYADISAILDEQGRVRPVREWPAAIRAAVAGVEVTTRNLTAGDGVQESVVKLRLWDKPASQQLLARLLGLLTDRVEVDVVTERLEARIAAARQRLQSASACVTYGTGYP